MVRPMADFVAGPAIVISCISHEIRSLFRQIRWQPPRYRISQCPVRRKLSFFKELICRRFLWKHRMFLVVRLHHWLLIAQESFGR